MVEREAGAPTTSLLSRDGVLLGLPSTSRDDAIRQAAGVLTSLGAVADGYADAMLEREQIVSSFVGAAVAIPHGTHASRELVHHAALAILQYPDGIDWDGHDVRVCVAIAAAADEHLSVMSALAEILLDADKAQALRSTDDPNTVLGLLSIAAG